MSQTGKCHLRSIRKKESVVKITRIGLDLAKNVFQVFGVDAQDKRVLSRQLKRKDMQAFFQALPACLIGMEACASAHYWAWVLTEMGHTVKLIAPQFVKPYVKGNKNDANDAEAICEAVSRPGMRFVPVKTIEQLHIQARHRVRSELIKQRTAKANQIRGLLAEYGIVIGLGVRCLRHHLPEILEEAENRLQEDFRLLLTGLRDDLVYLDERIKTEDKAIDAGQHPRQRPASAATARSRPAGGHGADRGAGGWPAIQERAPGLCLGRTGSRPAQQRRQADLAWHQQTGRHLPAHAADPRRPRSAAGRP
jgi:transposase